MTKGSADMQSQSHEWPRAAAHSSASAQRQVSGSFHSSNLPSHPKTKHLELSSANPSFINNGSGSLFNNNRGHQNNNTDEGIQFNGGRFHAPIHINQTSRKEKEDVILKSLYILPYKDRKNQNPDRVPGTCEWFVSHKLFQDWQESKSSKMLWVSADPGCGKSVLVKHLVDSVLPITKNRRVCYFFFKDMKDQKDVASAMCCILRQLFIQDRNLISDEILDQFHIEGEILTSSFDELWQILVHIANNENAREIVCLLDAIDECEEQGRAELMAALCKLYGTAKNFKLKFLITSRPERRIYCDFQPLWMPGLPVIHLNGESEVEMEKISREINIFIEASVQRIGAKLKLTSGDQSLLLQQLMRVQNRTYLWVYLTLKVIEDEMIDDKATIIKATSCLPKTVYEAYDRILSKGRDSQTAKRILHIVVAAIRPLTLKEMILALALRENHRSYDDIELESEDRFREKIRDICGLIVTIIDSRIYLLHQTVKEFLVETDDESFRKDTHRNFKWRHTLRPQESHRILAQICIQHLLFSDFETHTLDVNQLLSQYAESYIFFDYSAKHWATHCRKLEIDRKDAMVQLMLRICDTSSRRYLTWFRIYWLTTNTEFPQGFTTLMAASYFGLGAAVVCLLEMNNVDLNCQDQTYGRSALSWAAGNGFDVVVKLLIKGTPIGLNNLKRLFKRVKVDLGDRFGQTPLSYAVWNGNVAAIRMLIKAGAQVNLKDEIGGTPLSYAVCSGHDEVIDLLFKKGSKIGLEDDIRRELLLSASERGHGGVVKLLLDTGQADINEANEDEFNLLYPAAYNGHKAVVKLLRVIGQADRNDVNEYGSTPLHKAAHNGHEAVVKLLLDTGQADINKVNQYGSTPLYSAARNGHKAVVKLLLDTGQADINKINQYGFTPIHGAARYGHKAMVKLLLDTSQADINKANQYGLTPIHEAAYYGHEAVVKLLLDTGQADINKINQYGSTPIHEAAHNGHKAVVKLLLDTGQADINKANEYGSTTIHEAARYGHTAVVKLLLNTGQADINKANEDGFTPLYSAAYYGHEAVVKLLLDTGQADINKANQYGSTPLYSAAHNGHKAMVKLLLDTGQADINKANEYSFTPLYSAAYYGHEAVVKLLLDTGQADINKANQYGSTPLYSAAHNGHKAVVKLLLDTGQADINKANQYGLTPIHEAARYGYEAVVKLLLDTGQADINKVDRYGSTPLQLADRHGHKDMVKLLCM